MNSALIPSVFGIQSTAGAVPVKNDKGELSMQKVKVHRYVSGKRPEYAQHSSSDDGSDDEDFMEKRQQLARNEQTVAASSSVQAEIVEDDPRLRRLLTRKYSDSDNEDVERTRAERRRHIHEPEILEADDQDENDDMSFDHRRSRFPGLGIGGVESSEEEEEEELSDEEIEKRRTLLRAKALNRTDEELEVLDKEEDGKSAEESAAESSEYEEYTDSEEDTGPRLKPVFVRKKDRVTVIEKEKEAQKQKQLDQEAKKMAEERRRYTLKLVEEEVRKETNKAKSSSKLPGSIENDEAALNTVNTDDENDEVEYEAWKLRELKRIKRDREEREQLEKERIEIDKLRTMTEEERRQELRLNPKVLTNKATKGKYKFMQKYYHRGVFFLDNDNELLKRDFSAATLEDHFDKTILPKVMQVKNFGRSGRTKYTHLVDQDTTHFDSPWVSETAQNLKFHNNQAAGMRQMFEKPSVKKRKT